MDETSNETDASIDRRSLLKKAAVGGAVVWVAPTLLSSSAHAQGSGAAFISGLVQGGANVDLFSPDGGATRAAVDPEYKGSTNADVDGHYSFNVEPGHSYYISTPPCGTSKVSDVLAPGQTWTFNCFFE